MVGILVRRETEERSLAEAERIDVSVRFGVRGRHRGLEWVSVGSTATLVTGEVPRAHHSMREVSKPPAVAADGSGLVRCRRRSMLDPRKANSWTS